jgi:hypothetical protein
MEYGLGGGSSGPFDRYPAAPSAIAAAADELAASAGPIELVSDSVSRSSDRAAAGVGGLLHDPLATAPCGFRRRARRVYLAAQCAAGATRGFGRAVSRFDREVDALNVEWALAVADDFGVPPVSPDGARTPGGGVDPGALAELTEARADAVAAARAELLDRLRRRYRRAEADIDGAADETAGQLDAGPTDEVMQELYAAGLLPHELDRAFPELGLEAVRLPYDLARIPPDDLAAWLIDHPQWDDVALPQRVIDALGTELADRTRGVVDDPDGYVAVDQLLKRMAAIDGVDAAFIDNLGGAGLFDVILDLTVHGLIDDQESATLSLIATLKTATASATEQMTVPAQHELADELVGALLDGPANVITNDKPIALAYLLRDGTYDTAFLHRTGDGLDRLERDEGFGVDDWTNLGLHSYLPELLYGRGDVAEAYDPTAGLMSALGNNGEAALRFFTDGDGFGEGTRAEYYLRYRMWSHDDFNSIVAALDAATTSRESLLEHPYAAGMLASYGAHYLAGHAELGPGELGSDGARRLAHMMGTYMPSVDYANDPAGAWGSDGSGPDHGVQSLDNRDDLKALHLGANMPTFQESDLDRLFEAAVSNDDGFLAMREAVSDYQNHHFSAVLGHLHDPGFGGDKGMWERATTADARLDGMLLRCYGKVLAAEGAEEDEQIEDWIVAGQRFASGLPYSSLVTPFAVAGVGRIGDELTDQLATHEADAIDSATDAAEAAVSTRGIAAVETLYDNGDITRHELRMAAHDADMSNRGFNELFPPADTQSGGDGATGEIPDFPSQMQIRNSVALSGLVGDVLDDKIDMNNWLLNYESEIDGIDFD